MNHQRVIRTTLAMALSCTFATAFAQSAGAPGGSGSSCTSSTSTTINGTSTSTSTTINSPFDLVVSPDAWVACTEASKELSESVDEVVESIEACIIANQEGEIASQEGEKISPAHVALAYAVALVLRYVPTAIRSLNTMAANYSNNRNFASAEVRKQISRELVSFLRAHGFVCSSSTNVFSCKRPGAGGRSW